jgi:hypothetical protein
MTTDTASIEFLTGVDGRLDLAVRVRVGYRKWGADVQHKNGREKKGNGVYPCSLAQLCGMDQEHSRTKEESLG